MKARLKAFVSSTVVLSLAVILAFGAGKGCHRYDGTSAVQAADQPFDLDFQVKFILDSDKVLDKNKNVKEEYLDMFGGDAQYESIGVAYLETPDREFDKEGWLNRVRKKESKKKWEITYKKRYKVNGNNYMQMIQQALKDGFDPTDDGITAELDWNYSSMTLAIEYEAKSDSNSKTKLPPLSEAIALTKKNMPDIEKNWKAKNWGSSTLDKSIYVGDLVYKRFYGEYKGEEPAFDVWPIVDQKTKKVSYITELAFKEDDYDTAKAVRKSMKKELEKAGILSKDSTLKTQSVLNAYLGQ